MTDALEEAIRDWVDSFEVFPVGESKPIRLLADSVAFHRAKDFGIEWLWYITCNSSTHPDQGTWAWTGVATMADRSRWSARGISGGGGHPLLKGCPWVNLGGQLLEDGFRLGGWVEDPGQRVTAVRLIDSSDTEVEDVVANQVVLFRSNNPAELPLTVQLIDNTGAIAATHQFP